MPCPDEDTFARFVEGLLPTEAAAEIERHVDGCARCADLTAEFGRSFAEPRAGADGAGRHLAPLALAIAAVIHVVWAIVVGHAAGALQAIAPAALAGAYLRYVGVWAPAGGVVALAAGFCLLRGLRAGRPLAVGYALLSLPSIILTPLALFVLGAARRDRGGPAASGGR